MNNVDLDAGAVCSVHRFRATHGWARRVPEYKDCGDARVRSGLFIVRGVGIAEVDERIDYGAAASRSVWVRIVSSGFMSSAVACGSIEADPESLIELAARAALRECKRRNRQKAKRAAKTAASA